MYEPDGEIYIDRMQEGANEGEELEENKHDAT